MTYNVGIQSHSDLDVNTLKSITNEIFESASIQSATSDVKVRTVTGIDLYSGKVDSEIARQIAISNSGLQITLNNNLDSKLKFLNAKAAEATLKGTKVAITNAVADIKREFKDSNPFANGNMKATKKASGYLFINVA